LRSPSDRAREYRRSRRLCTACNPLSLDQVIVRECSEKTTSSNMDVKVSAARNDTRTVHGYGCRAQDKSE
jgi:hypothetical protein